MSEKTIVFVGKHNVRQDNTRWFYGKIWKKNAEELGYSSKFNDLHGLTKNDVVIFDKYILMPEAMKALSAKKVLFYPDVFENNPSNEYLYNRFYVLMQSVNYIDALFIPPNKVLLEQLRSTLSIPVYPVMFGVYTHFFSFIQNRFPQKRYDLGYCWLLGSQKRDQQAYTLRAKHVLGHGQQMMDNSRPFQYMLNAHYSYLLNNEQRLTEIPLSFAIPVSEPLGMPEQLADLQYVPIDEYKPGMFSKKEYKQIVRHNLRVVIEKYNSRTSLQQILKNIAQ